MEVKRTVWHDLYWLTWKNILPDEAYAHPAKFAPGLIQQIYRYVRDTLEIERGSHILDPFAGVACGAVYAMINGYNWTGHEIEMQFHTIGVTNIQFWREQYGRAYDLGSADILLKDSTIGPYNGPQSVIISSPPFGAGETRNRTRFQGGEIASNMSRAYTQDNQGQDPGNLARMKESPENFAAIVSSPPYGNLVGKGKGPGVRWDNIYHNRNNAHKISSQPAYGDAEGQLGTSSAREFWAQAQAIVTNCFNALQPGGYAIWVCKDYVRKGERIPFSDNWEKLCKSVGFRTFERIEASLVTDNGTQAALLEETEDVHKLKERKTFFRRQAERKGSPKIDHEDVIVMQRPANAQP